MDTPEKKQPSEKMANTDPKPAPQKKAIALADIRKVKDSTQVVKEGQTLSPDDFGEGAIKDLVRTKQAKYES